MSVFISEALCRNEFTDYLKIWENKEYKILHDVLYIGQCFENKSKVGITQNYRIKKREDEWNKKIPIKFLMIWRTESLK